MAKKNESKTERIKAFALVKKHWSETLHDPSADLTTLAGQIFVYLHRIKNTNYDGFRPNYPPFFPYGLKSLSGGGGLPSMHLYFTAIMPGEIENPQTRKHYLLTLFLPGLKKPFIGGDTFNYGLRERVFNHFYLKAPIKKVQPPALPNHKNWRPFKLFPSVGEGGLIVIPDGLDLTRAIEISLKEITQEEWKKGPWSFTDMFRASTIALHRDLEALEDRRRPRVIPNNVYY